jgi:hypothetical protein
MSRDQASFGHANKHVDVLLLLESNLATGVCQDVEVDALLSDVLFLVEVSLFIVVNGLCFGDTLSQSLEGLDRILTNSSLCVQHEAVSA